MVQICKMVFYPDRDSSISIYFVLFTVIDSCPVQCVIPPCTQDRFLIHHDSSQDEALTKDK